MENKCNRGLSGNIPGNLIFGVPGKSAYAYAVEAGYTGTEEEFAEQLAQQGGAVQSVNGKTGDIELSYDDLTDKPFYETNTYFNGLLNITWDGNPDGLVTVHEEGSEYQYCKVSDFELTDDQIKLTTVRGSNGYNSVTADIWNAIIAIDGFYSEDYVSLLGEAYCVRKSGVEHGNLYFPEPGIYFVKGGEDYTSSLTTEEPIEYSKSVVHKLDKKFLPDELFDDDTDDTDDTDDITTAEIMIWKPQEGKYNCNIPFEEAWKIPAGKLQASITFYPSVFMMDSGLGCAVVGLMKLNSTTWSEHIVFKVAYLDALSTFTATESYKYYIWQSNRLVELSPPVSE